LSIGEAERVEAAAVERLLGQHAGVAGAEALDDGRDR
jgi:hypothetical protein